MKTLILIFIAALTLNAHALSENEVLNSFSSNSNLQRAGQSFELCTEIIGQWPQKAYQERIQYLGAAWNSNPEAAYHVLSTCQTMWISRYLDPVKTVEMNRSRDRSKTGFYIAALDVVDAYPYLREEVRLFLTVKPEAKNEIPPSPFEVLTNLASSSRQMDEVLQSEFKNTVSKVASAGGSLAMGLVATKGFFEVTRSRSVMVARLAKNALLVAILAWGAAELADHGVWYARYSDLFKQTEAARALLFNNKVPRPIALDEFYKSTEQLGYFYSYSLYLKEGGQEAHAALPACHNELRDFFSNPTAMYLQNGKCQDAASLWIEASQYLRQNLSYDKDAQLVADRLMARAKRTFWSFEETRSYIDTLPVCTTKMDSQILMNKAMECRDQKTGDLTL